MSDVATAALRSSASGIGLPPQAVQQIADAIAAAELRTAAEIRVVIARGPLVQHPFFSVMWAALVALVVPWLAALIWPWTALGILQVQALIFLVAVGLLLVPPVAAKVVPRLALKVAARSAAIEAFLANGVSRTKGRTGILIFAAAHERLVEVVADEGVHVQLGPEAWAQICSTVARRARDGRLADGLVAGVEQAGELLSRPLPACPGDRNELPDRVIIL